MKNKHFTFTDLQEAFAAGEALKDYQWHKEEFCGTSCKCRELAYNDFQEWFLLKHE